LNFKLLIRRQKKRQRYVYNAFLSGKTTLPKLQQTNVEKFNKCTITAQTAHKNVSYMLYLFIDQQSNGYRHLWKSVT